MFCTNIFIIRNQTYLTPVPRFETRRWAVFLHPPIAWSLSGTKNCRIWAYNPSALLAVSQSLLRPFYTCTNTRLFLTATNCHHVKVPRFKSTFDLYNPNGSQAYPTATTPIIPRDVADTEGRTYVATMHFDRLGLKAGWRRAMWKKYRVLYVGSLLTMHEKVWQYGLRGLWRWWLFGKLGHFNRLYAGQSLQQTIFPSNNRIGIVFRFHNSFEL